MITKERLKELIEQGATIYSTGYREEVDLSLPCYIKDEHLIVDEGNGFEPTYLLKNLTENVEEAEWQAEFGCIERVERLVLPTWEEFETTKISVKFFNKNKEYLMYVFVKNKNTNNCRIIIYADDREQDWIVFEQPLTKKNYTKACRKAKELFSKEQSND